MTFNWTSLIVSVVLLIAAIPYVIRIRHPQQKLLAAYLIFVSVFILCCATGFYLAAILINWLEPGATLAEPVPLLLLVALVFVPAVTVATWLARKPPWKQGPPP